MEKRYWNLQVFTWVHLVQEKILEWRFIYMHYR